MITNPVTARQREVLQFMHDFQREKGSMPTMAEIAAALGVKSPNAAFDHALCLKKKGLVTLARGVSRGIQLTDAARELLGVGKPSPIAAEHLIALPVVDMAKVNQLARLGRAP